MATFQLDNEVWNCLWLYNLNKIISIESKCIASNLWL